MKYLSLMYNSSISSKLNILRGLSRGPTFTEISTTESFEDVHVFTACHSVDDD